MIVAVVGATARTGRYVVARLAEAGHRVIAVGRNEQRLAELAAATERAMVDLDRPAALADALRTSYRVISVAPARYTAPLLAALPPACERVVLTGSTRRHSSLDDRLGEEVRAAEAEFAASGVPGVMLHPSMIYGAADDRNVGRVLAAIRRWPARLPVVVPLPAAGRRLVQPVFVDDVADAMAAALLLPDAQGPPIDVVGPEPFSAADLVRQCATVLGRRARIAWAPPPRVLGALARLVRAPVTVDELLRLGEDKRYDAGPMARRLGVEPRPFDVGLRLKLAREEGGARR